MRTVQRIIIPIIIYIWIIAEYAYAAATNCSCQDSPSITKNTEAEIRCKALDSTSVLATCMYNDEWISCKSPVLPKTRAVLACANNYQRETTLLSRQSHVTCNVNGQWEPEPIQCVPVCGITPFTNNTFDLPIIRSNITEFPWHASLYLDESNNSNKSKNFMCGASIIQENLLITAAHCVYDELRDQLIDANKIYVLTGNIYHEYNFLHHPTLVKRNQVKRIYISRHYLGLKGNFFSDIAILELVQPFVLTPWLTPICIDFLNDKLQVGSLGKIPRIDGQVIRTQTVPIISFNQCKSNAVDMEQFITSDKFCGGYLNGSVLCEYNSGNGLVFQNNNLWYLRGIVSVALKIIIEDNAFHCDPNSYNLYTDISRYISWIQDVIIKINENKTHILCSEESLIKCSSIS